VGAATGRPRDGTGMMKADGGVDGSGDMATSGYTGAVSVGGPADVRELPGLTISKLAVSDMANNAYLLRDPESGEALLIDAAAEPEALLALIGDADLRTVVTTHGHWDHHRALPQVVEATGAATVAHPADAADLPVPVTRPVEHGDTVPVGGQTLDVVHLRGHTPGSIALVWRAPDGSTHVFTGDSLFPGGVGNTQQDPRRFASLIDDVEQRIFAVLPDDTWIYPGHGNDTTLGAERPHLGEWRERGW
jgi:glyoxylase-like metal-dependent hydrolase (beta-lactamase superfamily II)